MYRAVFKVDIPLCHRMITIEITADIYPKVVSYFLEA
jgi:hypothetical protein